MQLSVCIITYNHEIFIEQALNSVLEQDVKFAYEIVVGEDCSTDATAELLRKIENKNPGRVRVLYNTSNIGPNPNFSKTLANCRGEYIAFLEGDDFWTSRTKLQRQVDFLNNRPNASCVFHRTRAVNDADPSRAYVVPSIDPAEISSFDFVLQDSNPIAFGSLVARRACLSNLDLWLGDVDEPSDWLMCMMLATKGDIGFIPLEMSHYRLHGTGAWQSLSLYRRLCTTVRMMRRASTLLEGDAKVRVEQQIAKFLALWSREIVNNPDAPFEPFRKSVDDLKDPALMKDLLLQVASAGREAGLELRLTKKRPYNRLRSHVAKWLASRP